MKIEVLYFEGCPNHLATTRLVREALQMAGVRADIQEIEVLTAEQAHVIGFLGSPSVRVDGVDVEPEARGVKTFGFGCRRYFDGERWIGTPSAAIIRRAILELTKRDG